MNEQDLHNYQNTSVQHVIDTSFAGLFLEMGLGKTVSALTAINILMYRELEVSKVLVIAPKKVVDWVWAQECQKWDHLKHLKVVKIVGNPKQRKAALREKGDIFLVSRDNIAWLCGLYGGSMLPFDMCVVDESSSFKNHASVRFKALKKVQPSFDRVVILTGTPAPNGLIDLWSQIYLLDRGERFGKFITAFRRNYFTNISRSEQYAKYYPTKLGEKEIYRQIGDICISMKAKDYLDMKEPIFNDIIIHFDEALQKRHDNFEREQVMSIFEGHDDGDVISALNAAALKNKLLQFANGAVYDEDKNYHVVHNLKIEETKQIIESAGGKPVLIAWTYRHDMYRLMEALKEYGPRELKTEQDVDDWNAGKIQVLLMHPASGGHGLNLQDGGNNIIWFGQTWSLELYEQLNARLQRQGQKFVVVVHRLICAKSMDQDVIKSLARKGSTQGGLMDAVKARIEKYFQ